MGYLKIVLPILLLLIYVFWRNRRAFEQARRAQIKAAWGQVANREYEYEEFARISHYYKEKKGTHFSLDDITWNDLSLDDVFKRINHTWSSVGEEYLYWMLRTPQFDASVMCERERVIEVFRADRNMAMAMQEIYAQLGRARRIALADYLYRLPDAPKLNGWRSLLQDILLVLGIVLMIANQSIGLLLTIAMIVLNIITYYQQKAKVESYFACVSYLLQLSKAGKKIAKMNVPQLHSYQVELQNLEHRFLTIARKAIWITTGNRMSGTLWDMLMEYVRMITHVDLLAFEQIRHLMQGMIEDLDRLVEITGFLESCIAIASYRESISYYCAPETIGENRLEVKDVYHPLVESPVANSICANKGVLLTGSNASGKTTFLKTVALAAVMSQTIHTVLAHSYHAPRYRIYSSMVLKDNLEKKESYYMVEIKALKRMLDAVFEGDTFVLCFVDEVLRGTNTVERIAASAKLLESLSCKQVLPFAATHDQELTELLKTCYDNYHFEERMVEGDIIFPYQLMEGPARTRNAIRLLAQVGYDEAIVSEAERLAEHFTREGVWEL